MNADLRGSSRTARTLVQQAMRPSSASLGSRVMHGVLWQYGLTAFRVLITVGSTAVLARLLAPADYGIVAMAALITELAGLIANTGFGAILVQRVKLNRLDLDTAFWTSVGIGAALGVVVLGLAYPASLFFDQPALFAVLCVSGINFLIQGAAVAPTAILNRLLKFQIDAWVQVVQLVVRAVVAITLAWLGWSFWSLVVAGLVSGLVGCLIEFYITRYRPRFRFRIGFVRDNFKASSNYLGSSVLSYITANFDQFIVGRRFGVESLGYYQAALTLPGELRNRLAAPLQRVLFPAYSLLQDDLVQLRALVAKSQRILTAIVLPIGTYMAIGAEEIVRILYGPKWLAVIPLLQILAIGGAMRALFGLTGNIFFAMGRPDLAFRLNLLMAPTVVLGVWIGSLWGVEGVAWAMFLANGWGFYSAHLAMRLIGGGFRDFARAIAPAVVASAAGGAVLAGWLNLVGIHMPALPSLCLGILLSTTTTFICVWAMDRSTIQPVVERLFRKFRDRSPSEKGESP